MLLEFPVIRGFEEIDRVKEIPEEIDVEKEAREFLGED